MMNPYVNNGNNGNNNSLSPSMVQRQPYAGGYSGNGTLPNQMSSASQQQQRLASSQPAQPQRVCITCAHFCSNTVFSYINAYCDIEDPPRENAI